MFESINRSIRSVARLTEADLQLLLDKITVLQVQKNQHIISPGEICRNFYFINRGSCRHFAENTDGDKQIINLYLAGDWFTEFHSFTAQKPSTCFITAFEDSELLCLSVHDFHELVAQRPAFFQMGRLMDQMNYPNFGNTRSPQKLYEQLVEARPGLLLKFPLKDIASLLHLTPETISRIRAKTA